MPDLITCANFGEGRLKGLRVAVGKSLPFSVDIDRRPYNTLALSCECVLQLQSALQLPYVCHLFSDGHSLFLCRAV